MVVVMGVLLVVSLLAAGLLANSIASSKQSYNNRYGKAAYGAAVTGLRAAAYRVNATVPLDAACPALPTTGLPVPTPDVTTGICGPYDSDATLKQPGYRIRYQYWITRVLDNPDTTAVEGPTDNCTGRRLTTTVLRRIPFLSRCVTALGQAKDANGQVIATRRVQARLSAGKSLFPLPGIWGTACVAINATFSKIPQPGGGCDDNVTNTSSSIYKGAIGSNATTTGKGGALTTSQPIQIGLSGWNDNPDPATATPTTNPANLYLGDQTPTSGGINPDPYSIKAGGGPWATTTCASSAGGGASVYTYDCLPWAGNRPLRFGFYFPLPSSSNLFASPPPYKDILKRPAVETACGVGAGGTNSGPAVSCNNNGVLVAPPDSTPQVPGSVTPVPHLYSTVAGKCATTTPYTDTPGSPKALSVTVTGGSGECVLTLPDGTYHFCSIRLDKGVRVLPADQLTATSANAGGEVRIFLGNPASPGTCPGTFSAGGSGAGGTPQWFTTSSASNCAAWGPDTWTALAGQMYVAGTGDPTTVSNGVPYPPKFNHFFLLPPGMLFNGLIQAPNSTLEIDQNSCIRGGLAAAAVNVANGGNFTWDATVDTLINSSPTTFYQTAFIDCSSTPPTSDPASGC